MQGLEPGAECCITRLEHHSGKQNGCAYCIDMHTKHLRAGGETEQRLYLLDAWGESPFYTDRERAAEGDLANLTLAIIDIDSWNRLNIAFRTVAGSYQPATTAKLAANARK
jgi:AhpD family alkylhydroperoxidase